MLQNMKWEKGWKFNLKKEKAKTTQKPSFPFIIVAQALFVGELH